MRDIAIETAYDHLAAAVGQSIPSDDQIIMNHVRAAYEILKVVCAGDRKAHDPSPAEARLARVGRE